MNEPITVRLHKDTKASWDFRLMVWLMQSTIDLIFWLVGHRWTIAIALISAVLGGNILELVRR
jgi:hypothetical protein